MKTDKFKIADLVESEYNPRKALEDGDPIFESLKKSIVTFSDTKGKEGLRLPDPIIVNTKGNRIIGGHQRVRALSALGQKWIHAEDISWIDVEPKSEKEKALNLALNKIGSQEEMWDREKLAELLQEIKDSEFNIEVTGFDLNELDSLLKDVEKEMEEEGRDDLPEDVEPIARKGDIWKLGNHRILCGDGSDAGDVKRVMSGKKASMIFLDMQIGKYLFRDSIELSKYADISEYIEGILFHAIAYSEKDAGFYIWHSTDLRKALEKAMDVMCLEKKDEIVWAKPTSEKALGDYRQSHEPCFYAGKAGHEPKFYGETMEETVWRVSMDGRTETSAIIGPGIILTDGKGNLIFIQGKHPKRRKKTRHIRIREGIQTILKTDRGKGTLWEISQEPRMKDPFQKPVGLSRRAIENSSQKGEIVLDLFLLSGSTILGAEASDRICYGIEKDPKRVDVAVQRWREMTGEEPLVAR